MLEPQTYRSNEQLAKSLIPSWRVSQIHNLDHFERAGFPVRVSTVRELGMIIDTMQENRFDKYMTELGGLTSDEYEMILAACKDAVLFQLTFLPHRQPVLPISTLLSAFALRKKMLGTNLNFRSVLEIGPGCGYLSFFMRNHSALENYSQIEACESFYILQNLVNMYCFGALLDERALPLENVPSVDYFVNPKDDLEFSPSVRLGKVLSKCTHYPWWRIGEILSRELTYDIVTSNANLLEFNASALDDYLSLIYKALKPEGCFLVQCTGYPANGTVETLQDKIFEKGFAPLMFIREGESIEVPKNAEDSSLLTRLTNDGRGAVKFTTNNALLIRAGHPLFEKYYKRQNFNMNFVSPEKIVMDMFFSRPPQRRNYSLSEFLEATENSFRDPTKWKVKA